MVFPQLSLKIIISSTNVEILHIFEQKNVHFVSSLSQMHWCGISTKLLLKLLLKFSRTETFS